MKLSNQALYLFLILLVLLPQILAQNEGSALPPPGPPPQLPTYDQFLNHPTPDQFNQLTPEDQAKFFQDPLNVDKYPAIAAQYFGNAGNIGKAGTAAAEQKFFASENNVRAYLDSAEKHFSLPGNINKNKETAGVFLQQRYQAAFKIAGEGVAYDQDTKTLRYGSKVISLGEYSAQDSIEASGNCFKINSKSICGEVSTISFHREEESNQQSFEFKSADEGQQASAAVQSEETASLSFDSSGKLIVQGKIQGEITVGKEQIKYTNKDQDGSLEIGSNGEIKADNAEVLTTKVYLDGRFKRTLTNEGMFDYYLYSFNGQDTVLIDKDSKVGVRSQGQSQQLGEQVLVHLDSISEQSRYAQQKPREEQSPDELLKQARELRSSPAKTGNNGEVWIKKKATETLVYAEGKVDVGFYDGGRIPGRLPIENKPHFEGKSAGAVFDYRLEGSGESLSLAGQVEYSDSQYEKVSTTQDGATLNVQRQFNRPDDVLIADCKSCPASADPVITVGKRVAVSDRSTLGILSANRVDVSVYQTEKGLEYRLPTSGLGSLAEAQVDGLVGQAGRTLLMEIPCTTGEQCRLLFGKDQRGFFRGYYEAVDAQGQKRQQNLPLSIRAAIGKEIVVTTEKNREAAQQLLQLLQEKKIAEISSVQFAADPALRKLLQRELGIDIDLLSNPAYVNGLTHSAEKRGEFEALRQKINEDFGIEINEQGSCLGKKDCAKITQALVEATPLGNVYNAMRTKLVQSRLEAVKAQMETGASRQELRKLSQDDQKQLRNLVKAREGMETVRQQQQTARQFQKAMAAPLTSEQQADLDGASRVGQHKKDLLRDLGTQQKRQVGLQAQLDKYEREIQERKLEERSYTHLVGNVKEARQSLTEVATRIQAVQGEIASSEAFFQDLIGTYYAERPDLAARIAAKAGDADVAREISKTIEAISPDQAKLIVVEAELQEGNLKKAVEKAGEIERASSFAQADALLYDHVKQTLEERHREQSEAVSAKADEIKEKMSGFFAFFPLMVNKAMAVGAITTDFAQNVLQGELGTDESYAFYERQRREAGERAWQKLQQNAQGTAQLLQQLEMAQEEGLPVQDAFRQMATSTDPTIASAASHPVIRVLKEQVFARQPDEELAAEVLMQKARETIQFHDGKTAYGEMELRSICWEHPWTAACQQSAAVLENLDRSFGYDEILPSHVRETFSYIPILNLIEYIPTVSNRALDLYGDTAMDFAADFTNMFPFVSTFRLVSGAEKGWKAARMIGAAEGVAKVAQTTSVGVEAGRASKILSSVVNTVMNPKVWLTPTGRELTSAVTQAKNELQAAHTAANAEQVLAAGQNLDRAQRALNAYKTVQGVPTLAMREISVVSAENQAYKEMRTLAKGYDATVASRGVFSDEAIKIGEQIGAAAQRAEQASWSAGLGRWMGTRLAGEATVARQAGEVAKATTLTQDARRAEQLLQDLDAKDVRIVVEPETKSLRYDVQHLPPAEQKEAMDAVTKFTALQRKHGLDEQEIFDGSQKVMVDTAQLFDRNPTTQAATAILDDLRRQQATGAGNGVLPDVISSAGKDRAMVVGEIIPSPQQVEAEAELLSTTPSTPSLEQLVLRYEPAGGTPTEINRLQQAVQERSLAVARGEMAKTRELDYEIIDTAVRDPATGAYSGIEATDAYVNGLIGSWAAVNSRKVFREGEKLTLALSRGTTGEISLLRADIDFLPEIKAQLGGERAGDLQKWLVAATQDVVGEVRTGKLANDEAIIAQEIDRLFNDVMQQNGIIIDAQVGGRFLSVRPSLSVGIAQATPAVTEAIRQGEKNGAALLRTIADAALEEQRKRMLNRIIQLGERALPEEAAHVIAVTENEVAAAGKLVPQETDDLVGQVIANEGKVKLDSHYQVVKPEPSLEARVEKAVTGMAKEEEPVIPAVGGLGSETPTTVIRIQDLKASGAKLPGGNLEGRVIQFEDGTTTTIGRELGRGTYGFVHCFDPECTKVIKFAHSQTTFPKPAPDPWSSSPNFQLDLRRFLLEEVARAPELEAAGIPTARILRPDPFDPDVSLSAYPSYLVKKYIPGETLFGVLEKQGKLTPVQVDDLARLYRATSRHNVLIDLHRKNLIWDERIQRFVLIDNAVPTTQVDTPSGIERWENLFSKDPEGWNRFTEKAVGVTHPDELKRLPASAAPALNALSNLDLQEEIVQKALPHLPLERDTYYAQWLEARQEAKTKTLAEKLQFWKGEEGPSLIIPKYYHATSGEGLRGILRSGEIDVQQQQYFKGDFVSSRIEISPETGDYGDFALVFGSDIENLPLGEGIGSAVAFEDSIWLGFGKPISLADEARPRGRVAYLIARDDKVEGARALLAEEGITDLEVVPLSVAEEERQALINARIASSDRANVLLESGFKIERAEGQQVRFADLIPEGTTGSLRERVQPVYDSLQDGEIIIVGRRYTLVSIDDAGNKWLTTFDVGTRQAETRRLHVLEDDYDFYAGGATSVHELILSTKQNYRLGLKIDPQKARKIPFFELLADGKTVPIDVSIPTPLFPKGEIAITPSAIHPELGQILQRQLEAKGDEIMAFLARDDSEIEQLLQADAGVWEGYTIAQHNNLVYAQYNGQVKFYNLKDLSVPESVDLENLLKTSITLHDVGKPKAIAAGGKHLQHEFTLPILEGKLSALGFSPAEVRLAKSLVGNDVLGDLAKGIITPEVAQQRLTALAAAAGMDVADFYTLQKLFYTIDASSYPTLRTGVFQELPSGRLLPKSPVFETLDDLIAGTEVPMPVDKLAISILGPATKGEDAFITSRFNTEEFTEAKFRVPFGLRHDTVPGALDTIALAQRVEASSPLAKSYQLLRSTRPQTFSEQALEEIITNLDDLTKRNWQHGTTSRLLPQLRRTKEVIGQPALLPAGALQKVGIAPARGEQAFGTPKDIDFISGIDFEIGNVDAVYHYARLRGGYDQEKIKQSLNRLEQLLQDYEASSSGAAPVAQRQGLGEEIEKLLEDELGDVAPQRYRGTPEKIGEIARARLEQEKLLLEQFVFLPPFEQAFMEEGFPIIITARRDTLLLHTPHALRGEAFVEGSVNLADSDIVIFVEREKISEVKLYLKSLGIADPKVESIESFDVLNILTDSYIHYQPDGTVLTPPQLRKRLQTDPEFREFFKREIRNYLAARREQLAIPAAEETTRAVVGQAVGLDQSLINMAIINSGLVVIKAGWN